VTSAALPAALALDAFRLRTEAVAMTPPEDASLPTHAFTVDVEDWYQSCIDYAAPITERVVRNVDCVLEVLSEFDVKATFFVQGRVAEAFPKLVKSLVDCGHEVQSHGYSHAPLSGMDGSQLRQELERAKHTVEDAAGTRVTAFRAQDFSILAGNLWALETIADVGFEVDSSIFPMHRGRYGIAGWHLEPHRLVLADSRTILEVPVAIFSRGAFRLPVAGGGYFRLLPLRVIEHGLRSIAADARPPIIYCHPYEFNPTELADYRGLVSERLRRSQNLGRDGYSRRMRALLATFRFGRLSDVLGAWGLG
jgi:polysaccharide deacetylase family protein (PEP-CTERM system associated)